MPLDPEIAGLLALLARNKQPPVHQLTPQQARANFRELVLGGRPADAAVPVAEVREETVPGADGALDARIYRPDTGGDPGRTATFPTVLLFHGGGWVLGDLDTHDPMARALCAHSRAVVVSVAYRLAPEAPFPAAVDDAIAVTRWAGDRLEELGGDTRLAVAGDSAGGNLAAVVAQQLRSVGPPIAGQLLVYPATDATGDYPSVRENGSGYFLERPLMRWFMRQYAGSADPADPRLSPLRADDLAGLPPAVVVTAGFDPLRDEGEAYAAALRAAGVLVESRRFDSLIHGFVDMGHVSSAAHDALVQTCATFGRLLHADGVGAEGWHSGG
ncbi:MAG TPA: alpha/beta hydrolase [Nocardioidaceae bacterium]|nr:alpha/beta hydrolase [Nocardioidaceae bacterium]